MFYFAYGSNLSIRRLQQRVDTARLVTQGFLKEHTLIFHKIGRDGSAKCNAFYTGKQDDLLYGAVYIIDPLQKTHLDNAEGLGNGYEIKQVTIIAEDARKIGAFTYFATHIAEDIKPFHWYKHHVLAGAREHGFPKHYINKIAAIDVAEDRDAKRVGRELSIYLSEGNDI